MIEHIGTVSDTATVFAARIDGKFHPESQVAIVEMTDNKLKENISGVTQRKIPGKEYFLEVKIIREVLDGWIRNHINQIPSLKTMLDAVIYYAENDAYPESFFS